jgi:DNA-binding MarR family transcriptional regulator
LRRKEEQLLVTPEQELLSAVAKTTFRLNGQFLNVGEDMARPAGLTAAWWQVLGAVLHAPLPVAGIAREIGLTRQSVQRVADILVQHGLAEYESNPAHRRAKLLRPTRQGHEAVRRIGPAHAAFAARLAHELGVEQLRRILDTLSRLSEVLDSVALAGDTPKLDQRHGTAKAPAGPR